MMRRNWEEPIKFRSCQRPGMNAQCVRRRAAPNRHLFVVAFQRALVRRAAAPKSLIAGPFAEQGDISDPVSLLNGLCSARM